MSAKTKKAKDLRWLDRAFADAMRPRRVSRADRALVKMLGGYLAKLNGDNAHSVADYLYNCIGYYYFVDLVEVVGNWSKVRGNHE